MTVKIDESDFSSNPVRRVARTIISVESDYRKLIENNNSAAGGRVRKAALEAIQQLKELRKDVQALRNESSKGS